MTTNSKTRDLMSEEICELSASEMDNVSGGEFRLGGFAVNANGWSITVDGCTVGYNWTTDSHFSHCGPV